MRKELLALSHACGVAHPALVSAHHVEILDAHFTGVSAAQLFGYRAGWDMPKAEEQAEIARIMAELPAGK